MAQRMERAISVVLQRAVLGQHSKDIPVINMHYTSPCFSRPPQRYLVSETHCRSWPDILSVPCQISRLDILSVYLAIYRPIDRGDGTVCRFESIAGHDFLVPQP